MADEAFSADSKWMTGDWGGERTKLIEQGIDIKADYVGEMGYNAHGGYNTDKTGRYADQFGLGVALDLQKLWGWDNTQAKIQLTNRNGQNISTYRPTTNPGTQDILPRSIDIKSRSVVGRAGDRITLRRSPHGASKGCAGRGVVGCIATVSTRRDSQEHPRVHQRLGCTVDRG